MLGVGTGTDEHAPGELAADRVARLVDDVDTDSRRVGVHCAFAARRLAVDEDDEVQEVLRSAKRQGGR